VSKDTQKEIEDMECVPYPIVVVFIMYVMLFSRPDISLILIFLRRYMSTLGKEHWKTIKRVFKYFCGTKDYVIFFQGKPKGDSGK